MAYVLYYLILLPLSWLPLGVLYALGRGLYFLGYRVIGYRKKVVYDNIRGSFPEWTEERVREQMHDFYRYFFDSLAESIKLFSMSEEELLQRCYIENPELVQHLVDQGRSFIGFGGHYANYEIAALSFPLQLKGLTTMGIYSPLKNEVTDRLMSNNRRRTGLYLVSRRVVDEYYATDPVRPSIDFFIADQSPSNVIWNKVHWTRFLNRDTSFLAGPERYAVRYDRPVYYMSLRLVGRGHYAARLHPVTDHPRDTEPGYITEAFARQLENEIMRDPTPWLWTHRRWKRGVAPEAAALLKTRAYLPAEYSRELREQPSAEA